MTYKSLGSRTVTASADTTGRNTGNWTVAFEPQDQNINVALFEVQKITIRGGTPGIKFDVYIDINHYTRAALDAFGENEWAATTDGEFVIRPGQYVYYFFGDDISNTNPPTVVMWFKFDEDLRENQLIMRGG